MMGNLVCTVLAYCNNGCPWSKWAVSVSNSVPFQLARENVGNVFATDILISAIMCAPRSFYSWDIVAERVGDKLFFDKRPSAGWVTSPGSWGSFWVVNIYPQWNKHVWREWRSEMISLIDAACGQNSTHLSRFVLMKNRTQTNLNHELSSGLSSHLWHVVSN